jgi:GTPase SAR1 family protein
MFANEFKLSILGQPNIGKSLFVKRLVNSNNILNDYIPTLGVDVNCLDITRDRKIRLHIWDCAGDSRFRGLKEGYHLDTNMAIIFKKTNDNSYINYLNELPSNIPILYINDYNIVDPSLSVNDYKNIIFNLVNNFYHDTMQ